MLSESESGGFILVRAMTDTNHLLREYAESGSESAFREIVSRYVDLVFSVAFRRVGRNETLARDIVQTVFTDLARKAGQLRPDSSLGGWLHRHTCFVSSTVLRTEQRRLAREQTAVEMNQWNEPSEAAWQQLAPLLDEAIDQLGEADRQAIVLRFYERRDLRAVGAALGSSEDAAQKRLSRALEKLRTFLAGKGASLSAAALAGILEARAVTAAPAGLAPQVTFAALNAATAAKTGFIASLITLMTSLKLQLALGTVALGLIAGAIIYKSNSGNDVGTESARASVPTDIVQQGDSVAAGAKVLMAPVQSALPEISGVAVPESDKLHLTILAADSGRPIPGVQIKYRGWEKDRFSGKSFVSNRSGSCEVVLPRLTITQLELTAVCEGFADTQLDWHTERGETIPAAYTLRMTRPVPISGRVLDPDGLPVAGAKMGWNHQDDPASVSRPESHEFGWIEVETDREGRWQINRIAPEMVRRLYGSPRHEEFVSPPLAMISEDRAIERQLLDGTHIFRMVRALSISGIVVDPEGNPVGEANVWAGGVGNAGRREAKSLTDGSFTIGGCQPGRNLITAQASGFTASTVEVDASATTGSVRIALQRGKTLRLRLVDKGGQPIADANVWYDTMRQWRGGPGESTPPAVQVEFSPKTDEEGRAVWDGAPEGDLYFSFHKRGFMRRDNVQVPADGQEHVVTLSPALVVSGTVLDAITSQPIPKFRIACGWPSPNPRGEIQPRFSDIERFFPSFSGGTFRHSFEEPLIGGMASNPGYILKFEAEGYAPALSRVIKEEEGEVELEVILEKAEDLAVSVLLPDGSPAVDVEVGLLDQGSDLRLSPGGFSRRNSQAVGGLRRTDAQGIFKLPPDDSVQQVIAAGKAGFAQSSPAALRVDPTLRLLPWGRIEGAFASGAKAADRTLNLDPLDHNAGSIRFDFMSFQVRTGPNGRFTFPQVPAGRWKLVRLIETKQSETGSSWMHAPLEEIEVQAGQTAQLTLGAHARSIVARLRLPAGVQSEAETQVFGSVHTPFAMPPAEVQKDPDALQRWAQSPDVQALRAKLRSYPLLQNADGTLSADDVPAGEYILSVHLMTKTGSDGALKAAGTAELPVSIPAGDAAQAFDAGEILLQPAQ